MFDFKKEYAAIYRRIYDFHEQHPRASTDEEWMQIARELNKFNATDFEIEFATAVFNEIERRSKRNGIQ